jgi:hypothetical protein
MTTNKKEATDKAALAKAKRDDAARAKLVALKPTDTIESLCVEVAKSASSDYGATGRFAALLTATYGAAWTAVDLPNRKQADKLTPGNNLQASLFAVRNRLYDELDARLHANPSVVWGRIKKHVTDAVNAEKKAAEKAALANATPEEKAKAEKEAALEKVKSLRERALDNLTALNAAMAKVEGLSDDMFQCKANIEKAIKAINPAFVIKVAKTAK